MIKTVNCEIVTVPLANAIVHGQQTREMVVKKASSAHGLQLRTIQRFESLKCYKKVVGSILALSKQKNPFLRRIYLLPVRHND